MAVLVNAPRALWARSVLGPAEQPPLPGSLFCARPGHLRWKGLTVTVRASPRSVLVPDTCSLTHPQQPKEVSSLMSTWVWGDRASKEGGRVRN